MVRTRFSPSPTGLLHLGNVRAALFSALYAKCADGNFILRIEDTDATRSDHKYTEILQDDLRWLGIEWQEGPTVGGSHEPYFQSERHAIYDKYYQQLEEKKLAYPCFCTEQELALARKLQMSRGQPPRYAGTCRNLSKEAVQARIDKGDKPALRFQVPSNKKIEFTDTVKGPQAFNSDDIGDFIIRRAEGTASFMFCNAIDDSLMEITHVLRGEDHLANTPRQLMILQALDLRQPSYGHLSLITGDDGAPLSKRHGSFSLHDLRDQGYLSEAVLNYLARLGHTYDEQHLMTFDQLAKNFHLEKLSRSSARFDLHQLMHWQKEVVLHLDNAALWKWLGEDVQKNIPQDNKEIFLNAVKANITFPSTANEWADILFSQRLDYSPEQITVLKDAGENFFTELHKSTQTHGADIKTILDDIKNRLNVNGKKLFMPVRIALTGKLNGPELVHIAEVLGTEGLQQRFNDALEAVKK